MMIVDLFQESKNLNEIYSSELFWLEGIEQICMISHLHYGWLFLYMPVCSVLFLSLKHSKYTQQFKHMTCQNHIRIWIQICPSPITVSNHGFRDGFISFPVIFVWKWIPSVRESPILWLVAPDNILTASSTHFFLCTLVKL